jgi:hypothetical protein
MSRNSLTIASVTALTLGVTSTANAESIALDFDVPNSKKALPPPESSIVLPVPKYSQPPIELDFGPPSISSPKKIPPPENLPLPQPEVSSRSPIPVPSAVPPLQHPPKPLPPPPGDRSPPEEFASKPPPEVNPQVAEIPDPWWDSGSESPLAIALGNAEGTRRPDGGKNPAYYWHIDPGNGADNFGTFSYQHLLPSEKAAVVAAKTAIEKREASAANGLPDIADRRQLVRIRKFHDRLRQEAIEKGIGLNDAELIAGLDLANQAPLAALNSMGYLDRLVQMRQLPLSPEERIIEARVWSYWHPRRKTWDAPGLGNTYDRIRHDQQRRQQAIDRVLGVQNRHRNPMQPPPSQQLASPPPSAKPIDSTAIPSQPQLAIISKEPIDRAIPCRLCGF